ncbi:NADH-quinone oxidoreductase subunit J [Aeromicrobium senzhongii]|uniref:NADH-quinone oxidoreductase subunit J n=1 Tax=Aeromicrobium senzhongii TaxID=2663859 RepID=A0ABX6SW10_9ACTN|nr:NADH-quinone oxidoreductase subunit J [Aeromicrobium senzhongii]MTB88231.1 NADH-quinone oxidoreductase subunit J [Aeromicrobium senzhongii]QNL94782.1 NADH-quinone oxidoreductase subunit J [Aeromicrobium senzhongii]
MTAFWILAPVMVLAAMGLILSRKAVHAALCLAIVMICLAMLYAAQGAPFLFAVQIIVYTGAIMMLFLFVLMLVGVETADSIVETIKGQRVMAAVVGIGFALLLSLGIAQTVSSAVVGLGEANANGNLHGLASLLFTDYVLAFEFTAALMIVAVLGAMVLAHRERLVAPPTQADLQARRMRDYAESGKHPGNAPTPGVFARHNAVDTPALLPDGTPLPESIPGTLVSRHQFELHDAEDVNRVVGEIAAVDVDPDERPVTTEKPDVPKSADTDDEGDSK